MPWFGLGTWQTPPGTSSQNAVEWALEAGYRHIDTAALYGNEEDVGKALHASGVKREDVFVTTKVWNEDMRKGKVAEAMETSLKKFKLDHVDLCLLHWPAGDFVKCWGVMEKLLEAGKTRAIGVSNFNVSHLEKVLAGGSVVPAVNQVEWHMRLQLPDLMRFCRDKGITFESWAPLMRGKVFDIPEVVKIGQTHAKTAAQVAIRWGLQRQVVTIPKSVRQQRIIENADVFDFELTDAQMDTINTLDQHVRLGADPDNFNF